MFNPPPFIVSNHPKMAHNAWHEKCWISWSFNLGKPYLMSLQSQTTTTLCQLLKDGDEADRCYAARALGTIKDGAAETALIECLHDEDPDVCIDAAEALGRIGAESSVPALIESLENDPSGEICTAIASALGQIGGQQALAALRKVAIERPQEMEWDDDWDTWWDVQLEAVKALGRYGDTESADVLIAILEDETQQDIESELLHSLAQIPGPGTDYLIERLQNQENRPQARWRAAKALGHAAAADSIIKSLGRALKDPHPEVRTEAIHALARLKAERYLRALVLLLRDADAGVRKAALKAITELTGDEIDNGELQQELQALLDDPDSQVRATLFNLLAATVASHPLDQETLDKTVANLRDPAAETATAACSLLGRNGDKSVVPALIQILEDRNGHPMVRREAALVLGQLGTADETVLQSLSKAVGDKQQAVRLAALSALMTLEEAQPDTPDADEEQTPTDTQRPLDIIIAAVNGQIQVADVTPSQPTSVEVDLPDTSTDTSTSPTMDGRTGRDLLMRNPEPDQAPALDTPQAADVETASSPEIDNLALPETPARIVEEGEVKSATSTLDAIAMDNVEAVLEPAPVAVEQDAETLEYLEVVEENKELMRRIRSNRKIDAQQDVRRLGARILADSNRAEAVQVLIHALNDDDELLRREAAEAIGEIARKGFVHKELMDAVGTLITQLAVGEADQRLVCARALSHLGNQAAVIPLIEALNDAETNVRIQACKSLGHLTREGTDPEAADHMVVRKTPPLSVAKKLLERLDDSESGVRLAAAHELAGILRQLQEQTFTKKVVEKAIDSVFQWSGEEARLMGLALRGFDTDLVTEKLLARLETAEHSNQRSVIIEMLEELLKPGQQSGSETAA